VAWIRTIEAEEGDEALRGAYGAVAGRRGEVTNILKIHSLNPAVMVSHLRLYADRSLEHAEKDERLRWLEAAA